MQPTNLLPIRKWKFSTVLLCSRCAKQLGYQYPTRQGGTWEPETCPLCGEKKNLGEYAIKPPPPTTENEP